MSATGTVTGRHGKLGIGTNNDISSGNLVARTTSWAVNHTLATTSEWGDSDSGGYTNRAIGRRDATFTAEGKFDANEYAFQLFKIGDNYISAILWMGVAADNVTAFDDQDPNNALTWTFPQCICLDFNLSVDMDTEEVIGWTSSFGASGIFYAPGATGRTDPPAITD